MSARSSSAEALRLTVVIATYNRAESVARLLGDLAAQTLAPGCFEVVVVDDGSTVPVAARLRALDTPYRLTVIEQANGGPASARHRAIVAARGALLVVVDDDMRVAPDFLEAHLAAHPAGSRRVVLGRLRAHPDVPLRLHERYQLAQLDRTAAAVRAGHARLRGTHLYTGNVSLRRADYLAVGGFDPAFRLSEDAELGIRLEAAGVEFVRSEDASSLHASDHASVAGWRRRSAAYGVSESRIAEKHASLTDADPWRYLFLVNPLSRPALLAAALAPSLMRIVARVGMVIAEGLAASGAERVALAATTLVYGILYFTGVREHAGSARGALRGLERHLVVAGAETLGPLGRMAKFVADVRADHAALRRADAKYGAADRSGTPRRGWLAVDLVARIGFQMLVAYRAMRLLRWLRLTPLAMVASRLIRHLYGSDIHWNAEIAPGAIIVHGMGLAISPTARVGPGCVLFQHVTLGESIHPETRAVGAPVLEAGVHVGPGAALLGPITVGHDTKITANALLMRSVPARSVVEAAAVTVRTRGDTRDETRGEARGEAEVTPRRTTPRPRRDRIGA